MDLKERGRYASGMGYRQITVTYEHCNTYTPGFDTSGGISCLGDFSRRTALR
jgi:hypothetical protein